MKLHKLKIKNEYYIEIISGKKTFELRKNDRDYKEGDLIEFSVLCDGDIIKSPYIYQITYVLKNVEQYGLHKDYCILGIKKVIEEWKIKEYIVI